MSEAGKGPVLIITPGDPAGIGPEIIVRALEEPDVVSAGSRIIVLGYPEHYPERRLGGEIDWRSWPDAGLAAIGRPDEAGIFFVIPPGPAPGPVTPGVGSDTGARTALTCLDLAISAALAGQADAIVTGPIHKENLRRIGFEHPGHTECLAERAGGSQVAMMLVGGGLRVVLATIHEPLAKVPSLLNVDHLFDLLGLIGRSAADFGLDRPRIGVAGLNPHAGEGGLFGREEIEIIAPAVARARTAGVEASGPFSADTLFHRALKGEFDIILAMYHDQGLIPVKTLDFHGGVNVTLGLPFIRTSPDHGVAYEIAGRGVADPGSMAAAIRLAESLAGRRRSLKNDRTDA